LVGWFVSSRDVVLSILLTAACFSISRIVFQLLFDACLSTRITSRRSGASDRPTVKLSRAAVVDTAAERPLVLQQLSMRTTTTTTMRAAAAALAEQFSTRCVSTTRTIANEYEARMALYFCLKAAAAAAAPLSSVARRVVMPPAFASAAAATAAAAAAATWANVARSWLRPIRVVAPIGGELRPRLTEERCNWLTLDA
jgi:hypothetical protein